MEKAKTSATVQCIMSMVIFGTIGIFVRYIGLPSGVVACVRGAVGTLFLLGVCALKRTKPSVSAIRANLLVLCVSGILIGLNWILLFESYRYTTVAVSTLCYYMAPVFVILASPIFLREKLTVKKILCVLVAVSGMVLVSGVVQSGIPQAGELKGILCGLGAAVLYAGVVLLNQKLHDITANDRTMVQLTAAVVAALPYTILIQKEPLQVNAKALVFLLLVGILHTGFAYSMYFGSMQQLKAQTVAIFSYIDPVVAVILSIAILHEKLGVLPFVGAVMILGAALVSELPSKQKK